MSKKVSIFNTMMHDFTFKFSFGNTDNIEYLEYLLELLENKPFGFFKDQCQILNSELRKKKIFNKGCSSDIFVKAGDKYINLEAFGTLTEEGLSKSFDYLVNIYNSLSFASQKYQEHPEVVQYIFCMKNKVKRIEGILNEADYYLKDGTLLQDKLKTVIICLDKVENPRYNVGVSNALIRMCKILKANTNKERKALAKGDKVLMSLVEKVRKFISKKNDYQFMSMYEKAHFEGQQEGLIEGRESGLAEGRREGRKSGLAEGQTETQKTIAKKLLSEKKDVDYIAKLTGLAKKEVMRLL